MGPPANLYGLDEAPCDVLVLAVRLDGRPLAGLTGHVDWRTGGRISRLVRDGAVPATGPLLLPAPPVLGARRLLLWATDDVTPEALARCLKGLGDDVAGLCPADLGLEPGVVRAALGPRAVLYTPEAGEG
ncbi:MAG: hypothetical protein H6706_28785 [Myxococcales bacterium]|nr:hypothetical protein [Myxococcales bacterium]